MLKKSLIAIVVIVVVLVVIIALQPSEFRVARSGKISAPAAKIFAHVNDLHLWESWSPWEKVDPALKRTYEGAEKGVGAIYSWAGNNDVGEGRMTVIESKPDELIRIQLEFFKPYEGKSTAEFTFEPAGDQTLVTWSMTGTNNFLGKAMCLVMNMDQMIGGQFEKGLAGLKTIAETESESPPAAGTASASETESSTAERNE